MLTAISQMKTKIQVFKLIMKADMGLITRQAEINVHVVGFCVSMQALILWWWYLTFAVIYYKYPHVCIVRYKKTCPAGRVDSIDNFTTLNFSNRFFNLYFIWVFAFHLFALRDIAILAPAAPLVS